MAERKRIVLPLVGGEDRGTDPLVLGDRLATSRNTIITREGAVEKRTAFVEVSGSYTEPNLAAFKDRPVLLGDTVRVGVDEDAQTAFGAAFAAGKAEYQTSQAAFVDIGNELSVYGNGDNPNFVDVGGDPANGWYAIALTYSTEYYIAVLDEQGNVLAERWQTKGTGDVHVVTSENGDCWYLLIESGNLVGGAITATAIAVESTLYSAVAASQSPPFFDAAAVDGDIIIVAYETGSSDTRVLRFDASAGSVTDAATWALTASHELEAVCVFRRTTDMVVVGIVEKHTSTGAQNVSLMGYDCSSTLSTDFSAVTADTTTSREPTYALAGIARSATALTLYWTKGDITEGAGGTEDATQDHASRSLHQRRKIRACDIDYSGSWSADTPLEWLFHAEQLSRPWLDPSGYPAMLVGYLPRVASEPDLDYWPYAGPTVRTQRGSTFLVRDDRGGSLYYRPVVIGKCALDRTWLGKSRDDPDEVDVRALTQVVAVSATVWTAAVPLQAIAIERQATTTMLRSSSEGRVVDHYSTVLAAARGGGGFVATMDFATTPVKTTEGRDWLLVPNSCPYEFDGRQLYEQGFLTYPEDVRVHRFGHAHYISDTTNDVTATYPPTDLAEAIALVNDLKLQFNAHIVMYEATPPAGVHLAEDTDNPCSTANASDQATLEALIASLHTKYNAHIADTDWHWEADTVNGISYSGTPSGLSACIAWLTEAVADYEAHRVRAGQGYVSGTVRYCIVPHASDEAGNSHWGAPVFTEAFVVDSGASWGLEVEIACATLTRRRNIEFYVFRTKDGPGASYYYIGRAENKVDYTYPTTSVYDTLLADAALSGTGPYTEGGVLEHVQAPPHRVATVWQGRHICAHREYESWMLPYSSVPVEKGSIGHNEALQLWVNPAGGAVTALAVCGERLIIFKSARIYAADGQGLDATGQGVGHAEPVLVSSSVGCTDKRTVVEVPAGLMFLSATGLMLLDRSLQVHPIGQPMRHYTDTQTIACGVAVPELDCAIWLCGSGEYALVFNWRFNRWMTWSQPDATDACVIDGKLWAKSVSRSNKVVKEDRTAYLDWASTFVQMVLRTGWLHPAGPHGFGRIKRLGLVGYNAADHILKVTLRYNGDPHDEDVIYLDSSTLENFDETAHYGADLGSSYDQQAYLLQFLGSRQRMTSVQIEICDVTAIP